MTGQFSDVNPERCAHYARFFQHLELWEANLIFWSLFGTVILLLSIASIIHHKSIALGEATKKLPREIAESQEHKLAVRRRRVRYLSLVTLCAFFSVTCTVFECFAAFNIEYCDGEDLMMLYWGFWSILQVGSNIAILGVILQFWIVLGDVETPSWAVALGTPVLVFAALGFVLKEIWKKTWRRCFNQEKRNLSVDSNVTVDEEEKGTGPLISQVPTIVPIEGASRNGRQIHSFWSRDLHYLISSIVNDHPNEDEDTLEDQNHTFNDQYKPPNSMTRRMTNRMTGRITMHKGQRRHSVAP
ncbi:BgTH12-02598 [Blumeria graminis f. sp. triticale]|uniref:BgTH12-02598 n=1 Tax=Blumeria graminis f. sp. triticale TaxID=1689686 RepID=A0A9W4D2I3_BLUGR|nr:BgTH12-02598 [Blumeria graminis f. sp. triticale]